MNNPFFEAKWQPNKLFYLTVQIKINAHMEHVCINLHHDMSAYYCLGKLSPRLSKCNVSHGAFN